MVFQYQASSVALGSLLTGSFSGGPAKRLFVPDYQRSYSWTTEEVDALWSDISRFSDSLPGDQLKDRSYFLGAVVLVDTGQAFEILDGQQRIATCTILLAAIRDHLLAGGRDKAAQALGQKYIATVDYPSESVDYLLTLNVYDRDYFRSIIQESKVPHPPKTAAQKRIQQAYELIMSRVADFCGPAESEAGYKRTMRLQQVLTDHVSLVGVVSSTEDEAADIFEALNDRGISLSTPDLVRTLLIRRAKASDQGNIVEQWGQLFELEAPARIDDLLRYYWITREGDQKTRSLYRFIRTKVTEDGLSPTELTKELVDAGEAYEAMVRGDSEDKDLAGSYVAVKSLNAKALYPILLSLHFRGTPPWSSEVAHAAVSLYMRHTVIGGLSNSTLETLVYGVARELRRGGTRSDAIEKLASLLPSDQDFRTRFTSVALSRQATVRYILTELERHLQGTGELTPAGPDINHIEHIYPQNPPAEQRWENHADLIWRLGNLTLLVGKANKGASNLPYAKKRSDYYSTSKLELIKTLPDLPDWTPAAIAERQGWMADAAVKIWTVPQP